MTDALHFDTQFNEIWNNDNQHNDSKHNYTRHGKQLFHSIGMCSAKNVSVWLSA